MFGSIEMDEPTPGGKLAWHQGFMRQTHIKVPANLSDKSLIGFFSGWYWIDRPDGLVTFDFRDANFLSPWALTLFASYALWLRHSRGKKLRILVDQASYAGNFLCRSGFMDLIGQPVKGCEDSDPARTARLSQIADSGQIPAFATQVMKILDIDDPEVEGALKYSLVELLRNVVQHSQSTIGGVAMAQYYPNTGIVELVVADVGVGIQDTLATKYPEIDNDFKSLKFATQPHVSGTFAPGAYSSMHENAGLGLFFIKQIASLSGGCLQLASGAAIADVWGDQAGQQQKRYAGAHRGGWPGTFAVLQLKKDSIADFDGVLRVCRQLAEAARKDPRELWLDFIEEIPDIPGLTVISVSEFEENVEEAARVRETIIAPALRGEQMVVLDFSGISFATQSFIHALMYRILRDNANIASALSVANCTESTREAILAVAGYATIPEDAVPDGWQP